jgi:hypothetical protein
LESEKKNKKNRISRGLGVQKRGKKCQRMGQVFWWEGKCQLVLQPDNSPDTSTVGMVLDFIRRVSHNRRRENETKTKVSTARWLTAEMEGEVM